MSILLWTLALLLGAVLLAALARRIEVPSPSLLALGGVLVGLLPHGPRISLEPDLALALFVAPDQAEHLILGCSEVGPGQFHFKRDKIATTSALRVTTPQAGCGLNCE